MRPSSLRPNHRREGVFCGHFREDALGLGALGTMWPSATGAARVAAHGLPGERLVESGTDDASEDRT